MSQFATLLTFSIFEIDVLYTFDIESQMGWIW